MLTEKEKAVLKILVKKELEIVEQHNEEMYIVNSPFLSSVSRLRSNDLEFMKTEKLYREFLSKLLEKI